ncbi:hypothetical protein C922_05092 [Plasmodium inui San Antonio 1]|uniref:Uncharacterized protein n=1 Tax=Plasmodium inui San Antonio 1 TaxID=1237626 RepID=W6ZZ44_9APIC|nr:hypothetical protein C922_05092 [Plasmodium inui San Antonio 1]EUD64530.1 hypothetical protein C922_05092 [Plasmodium inui San Antonio 1]
MTKKDKIAPDTNKLRNLETKETKSINNPRNRDKIEKDQYQSLILGNKNKMILRDLAYRPLTQILEIQHPPPHSPDLLSPNRKLTGLKSNSSKLNKSLSLKNRQKT